MSSCIYIWCIVCVYIGSLLHNEITGRGKYVWPDGSMYEGEVKQGQRHGKGQFTHISFKKSKEIKKQSNNGIHAGDTGGNSNGNTNSDNTNSGKEDDAVYKYTCNYDGDWMNGMRHGKGRLNYDPLGRFLRYINK